MSETSQPKRPSGKRQIKPKRSIGLPAAAVIAVGTGLAGAYVVGTWPDATVERQSSLATSAVEEFQQSGVEGFRIREDDIILPQIVTETVTVVEQDTSEINRLNRMVADLNAKIEELGEGPDTVMVADTAALSELRDALERVQADLKLKDQSLKELARDNLRLSAQLGEDELARQQFEEERTRKERLRAVAVARQKAADQLHADQVNSPMVAFRRGSGKDEAGDAPAGTKNGGFVRAGLDKVAVTRPEIIANPLFTVVQGTLIEATLQTGINSDQQGNVKAVVSYDVWSFDLERVLIPRGSRLFGRFSSDVGVGQKRVLVAWDRIITPDGLSVSISAYGADRLGRSGLPGKVNNHFVERFGTAAVISIIGAAPEILANQSSDETTAGTLDAVGNDLSSAVGNVIAEHIARPATITIEHGDIVTIIVNTDLELL
jgi:type IV secretion system protein VirB10